MVVMERCKTLKGGILFRLGLLCFRWWGSVSFRGSLF